MIQYHKQPQLLLVYQEEIFNIEGELVNNVINNDSISEAVAEN